MPTHESFGAGDQSNSGTSLSWLHTIAGDDRFTVVKLGHAEADNHANRVTVGGKEAFCLGRLQSSTSFALEVWGCVESPTGSQTVLATFANSLNDGVGNSSNYTDVDQFMQAVNLVYASGNSTAMTATVNSKTGDRVVAGGFHDATPTMTIGTGTERWQEDPLLNDGTLALADTAGAATATIAWTLSAAQEWDEIGFSLQPAGTYAELPLPISTGVGDQINAANTTDLAWNHEIDAVTDGYLVIHVNVFDAQPNSATVTVNGSSAGITELANVNMSTTGSLIVYGLKAPPVGTAAIIIDFGADTVSTRIANSFLHARVDQTTPTGTVATANGTSTTPGGNVASTAGELVVDFVYMNEENGGLPDNDQFPAGLAMSNSELHWHAQSRKLGETTTAMGWTMVSAPWAWCGFALKGSDPSASSSFGAFGTAGAGETDIAGPGASAFQPLGQAGIGVMAPEGAGGSQFAATTQAGVGEQPHEGVGATIFAALTEVGAGIQTPYAEQSFPAPTQNAFAFHKVNAAAPTRVGSITHNDSDQDSGRSSASFNHTVAADTTLLLVTITHEGNEAISGTPTYDGDNLTEIHDTGLTGANNDIRAHVYGIVFDPPAAKTGTVSVTYTNNNNVDAISCINYKDTPVSSVADATNFVSEDVDTGTGNNQSVLTSGGSSGNTLFIFGSAQHNNSHPVSFDSSFSEIFDVETGADNADITYAAAELTSGLPSGVTITYGMNNEHSAILIELVAAPGQDFVGGGATVFAPSRQAGSGTGGDSGSNGTGVSTAPALTQAGAGEQPFAGAGAAIFTGVAQAGVGLQRQLGAGAQILPLLEQVGVGEQPHAGVGVQALPAVAQDGSGLTGAAAGAGAQEMPALGQTASGSQPQTGAGVQTMPSLEQAGEGQQPQTGVGVQTLPSATLAGNGESGETIGGGAQTLPAVMQTASGAQGHAGSSAIVLPSLVQSAVEGATVVGSAGQVLPAAQQSSFGGQALVGVGAHALPAVSQLAAGIELINVTSVQVFPALIQSASGTRVSPDSQVGAPSRTFTPHGQRTARPDEGRTFSPGGNQTGTPGGGGRGIVIPPGDRRRLN